MDILATVKNISTIVLMGAGAMLLVALAILIIRVSSALSHFARSMEKIAGSATDAGLNVVAASENSKGITENQKGAAGYATSAIKDIAETTPLLRLLGVGGWRISRKWELASWEDSSAGCSAGNAMGPTLSGQTIRSAPAMQRGGSGAISGGCYTKRCLAQPCS